MVQYKKDEIREKIESAALSEFAQRGYDNTTISDIAKKSKISVGNIYRYFGSKDEIFSKIIPESFLSTVKNLLINKMNNTKNMYQNQIKDVDEFWIINDEIIEFMVDNREKMLIVYYNNKGTKYENAEKDLVEFLIKTVKEKSLQHINKNMNDLVLKIIYENLLSMTISILRESKRFEEVKENLKIINSYHMFGIKSFFSN